MAPGVREFWDTMIDAVAVFRGASLYAHPYATYRGCAILPVKNKPFQREFRFIAKNGLEVVITLDYKAMADNPELYFDNMMESLDQKMRERNVTGKIFVPPEPKIAAAMH